MATNNRFTTAVFRLVSFGVLFAVVGRPTADAQWFKGFSKVVQEKVVQDPAARTVIDVVSKSSVYIPIIGCLLSTHQKNDSDDNWWAYRAIHRCKIDLPNGATIRELRLYGYTDEKLLNTIDTTTDSPPSSFSELRVYRVNYLAPSEEKRPRHEGGLCNPYSDLRLHPGEGEYRVKAVLCPSDTSADTSANKKLVSNDYFLEIEDYVAVAHHPYALPELFEKMREDGDSLIDFVRVDYEMP